MYFGLVLVGATPPVAARAFDDGKILQISEDQTSYDTAIYALVRELENLSRNNKFDWSEKIDLTYQFSVFKENELSAGITTGKMPDCNATFRLLFQTAQNISRNLSELENDFSNRKNVYLTPFDVSFSLSDSGVTIKAFRSSAGGFSNDLLNRFERQSAAEKSGNTGKIYENTKISAENNQVFVVTRLPRASIDELLAETNAK